MNWYQALELETAKGSGVGKGYFHFTKTNDGVSVPVGYCAENMNDPVKCHHKTAADAADCYRNFCADKNNGIMAGFPMDNKYGTELNFSSSY